MKPAPEQPEHLQFATKSGDQDWSNPSLVAELFDAAPKSDPHDNWLLARWSPASADEGGLKIRLSAPNLDVDLSTQLKLAELITQKLGNGLSHSSHERGWPRPRFTVLADTAHPSDEWTYRLELGPYRSDSIVIHPNKILAVGEEISLSHLLGLECMDPVFGLPAKWITYSQSERASENGCLLFEATEVLMSHAISFTQSRAVHGVGQWEVVQWASHGIGSLGPSAQLLLENESSLLAYFVKNFIKENLHLPGPSAFLEAVLEACLNQDRSTLEIEREVRKSVVLYNIPRWKGDGDQLHAIEWEAPLEPSPEEHQRMLARLQSALESRHDLSVEGTAVLLVDAEQRSTLANSLAGLFPDLPVLSWSEIEDLSEVAIVAHIDPDLAVDPSVLPARFYTIEQQPDIAPVIE